MVVLSFLENAKDVASRLLPSPYMDLVEEATRPHLSTPEREAVSFLCDIADSSSEAAEDVVHAVRRRITDSDAKVQCLVVLLLDALMRSCDVTLHAEVAAKKGLLRDLQNIATRHPCVTERDRLAKNAALALILNLSVWFTGHSDERLYILTTISDDVRQIMGPNAFDGVRPDTSVHLSLPARRHGRGGSSSNNSAAGAAAWGNRQRRERQDGPVVDAVGINFPTEEELAAMLDCCMTLAEYLNNVKVQEDGSIEADDIINGFRDKIQKDHELVVVMLSSDLKLNNRDVLQDISSSQAALIRRMAKDVRFRVNQISSPRRATSDVASTERYHIPPQGTTPKHSEAVGGQVTKKTNPPASEVERAAAAPSVGTTQKVTDEVDQPESSHVKETAVDIENLFVSSPHEEGSSPPHDGHVRAVPTETDSMKEVQEQQEEEEKEKEEKAQEEKPKEKQRQDSGDDDEFDAFLDGRLSA